MSLNGTSCIGIPTALWASQKIFYRMIPTKLNSLNTLFWSHVDQSSIHLYIYPFATK